MVIEQDVDVDPARPPAKSWEATETGLEMLQMIQKICRSQEGLTFEDHIQEGGLVGETPGGSLVDRRAGEQQERGRQGSDGCLKIGKAVTEVGTEGKINDGHGVDLRTRRASALLYSDPTRETAPNHLTPPGELHYTEGSEVFFPQQ
jgi:hypothetical protein